MSPGESVHLIELRYHLPAPEPPLAVHWHSAAGECVGRVLMVAPFAEEKKAAQRALVEAARAMAAVGYTVVRFDLRGTGDSGGTHGEADVDTWIEDIRAVLGQFAEMPEAPLTILGVRFGAALAWRAACALGIPVDQLALWEPITSGSSYARQNRQRSRVRQEMTSGVGAAETATGTAVFDFDGFELSAALESQMEAIDLSSAAPPVRRALVLQVGGSTRLKKPLEALRDQWAEAGVETTLEAISLEPFWSAIGLVDTSTVTDATLRWMGHEPPAAPQVVRLGANDDDRGREVAPGVTAIAAPRPFVVSGGEQLAGVLYDPGEARRAVLLLHGWSGYRTGPGQLLSDAARAFAQAGCLAYSFDFRGRGESGGEVGQTSLGTMIDDAAAVVAKLGGELPVTLVGICSGCEVALGAALSDPRIDSLALWSAPIFSGNMTIARQARRSASAARGYAAKLFRKETWAKLLGGRLNWNLIVRALRGGRSSEDAAVADKGPDTATAMEQLAAYAGRMLFIYGGNDPETEPSRQFYREFVESAGIAHAFHELPGANHNFFSLEWKREVIETTIAWLEHEG